MLCSLWYLCFPWSKSSVDNVGMKKSSSANIILK
jgi:hypothetical protein